MAQRDPEDHLQGPGRPALLAGSLLFVLGMLVSIADGVGSGLVAAGFVALAVGAVALVRGRAHWLSIAGRRAALVVTGAGLTALLAGGAVSPSTRNAAAEAAAPASSPPASAAAGPSMQMTCPARGTGASPVFGRQISASGPFTVTIDYGDGDVYRNDGQHLSAIFSHTYRLPGTYPVQAVLTDAAGQVTSAACSYTWTARH